MTPALERLRAYLCERDDADSAVGPTMRSQLLDGSGDEVIVLLHGLTASPLAWELIAAAINARGPTVVIARLPLHGHADRMTTALQGLSAALLTTDLRKLIEAIGGLGKRVVIGGHSLGGALAIHAAANLPGVDRIVAIAPFLGIAGLPDELRPLLISLLRRLPNRFLWWDPALRERQQPAHGYPRYPLHSLAAGLAIAAAVGRDSRRMPRARAIDLVINAGETSVNNRAVRRLAARWAGAGAAVAVHQLAGLPPSHDIIEPARSSSARVRETLVRLLVGEGAHSGVITHHV